MDALEACLFSRVTGHDLQIIQSCRANRKIDHRSHPLCRSNVVGQTCGEMHISAIRAPVPKMRIALCASRGLYSPHIGRVYLPTCGVPMQSSEITSIGCNVIRKLWGKALLHRIRGETRINPAQILHPSDTARILYYRLRMNGTLRLRHETRYKDLVDPSQQSIITCLSLIIFSDSVLPIVFAQCGQYRL